MRVAAVAVAVGALLLGGCSAASPDGSPATGPTPTVTISPTSDSDPVPPPTVTTAPTTTLTGTPQRGVEAGCLLLDQYLLIGGDRTLLESGVAVRLTGHVDRTVMTFCQQGTPFVVESATRVG
jgi:hypothetical protein